MITKEMIFKEFEVAKEKDLKESVVPEPFEDCFKHRLELLKSHLEAKKTNPSSYRHLDIKFENLIKAYSSPSPIDHFYKVVFGKTYEQYMFDKALEDQMEKELEKIEKLKSKNLKKDDEDVIKEVVFN